MTTEASTLMSHFLLEGDVETPTVEVDALGAFLVEDGDVMDAEHVRSSPWACFCIDRRHRDLDRRPLEHENSYLPTGAHPITVHIYAVVTESHMTTKAPASATASAVETVSEAVITGRFTTCACPNPGGPHHDPQALTRSHARESDAEIIARHTGRHVVPVSEMAEVTA